MPPQTASLDVHLLPRLVAQKRLRGQLVVMIDVLRATTTITWALANGAREVIPFAEIDEAQAAAARLPRDQCLLGGERGGMPIAGFDLGNSPREYTPERVRGKTILFTTTNGTRALWHCREAHEVLLGAFVNLSDVVDRLAHEQRVSLLCAGTEEELTREDALLAGCIVDRLVTESSPTRELNDQAKIARDAWREIARETDPIGGADPWQPPQERLVRILRDTAGGRNLVALGLDADIADAARIDRFSLVPRFVPGAGSIRADER
jgi:2-phosphosulfolactate phosphatase